MAGYSRAVSNVKGRVLASRLTWVRLQHGPDALDRVRAAASPALAELLDAPVDVGRWYPQPLFVELNELVDRQLGAGDGALVKQMGKDAADASMTTIYRLFFKIGTVRWVMARAARLWHMHYDTGRVEVAEHGPRDMELHLIGVMEPSCTQCRAVQGWTERSVELSGGADVVTSLRTCRRDGAASCCISTRWK